MKFIDFVCVLLNPEVLRTAFLKADQWGAHLGCCGAPGAISPARAAFQPPARA